jgi:hypothetical protein
VNRAEQIRRASKQANLPYPAVVLIDALLSHTDWRTGLLPADRQPRSVEQLARWAGMPRSTCETALDAAERYGWVERTRPPGGLRRGASVTYQVRMGRTRPGERREHPLPGSERTRRWRQRQREAAARVTAEPVRDSPLPAEPEGSLLWPPWPGSSAVPGSH